MENDKLFDFMEKMYSDITKRLDNIEGTVQGIKQEQGKIIQEQEETNKRLTKIETKIESMDKRLSEIAEVQKTNYAENERHMLK